MKNLTQYKSRNTSRNSLTAHRNVFAAFLENRRAAAVETSAPDREKLEKQANIAIALKLVRKNGNLYEAETPSMNGSKTTFELIKTSAGFACDCCFFEKHKTCSHVVAAEMLSNAVAEAEKPFKAVLLYGNRKGLDFTKRNEFDTKDEATRCLVREAENKFLPEGTVTDRFGEIVFEIADEFFEMWDAA